MLLQKEGPTKIRFQINFVIRHAGAAGSCLRWMDLLLRLRFYKLPYSMKPCIYVSWSLVATQRESVHINVVRKTNQRESVHINAINLRMKIN
jgi:hypothetical protein